MSEPQQLDDPDEVVEPEFNEARVTQMRELSNVAALVEETVRPA
jgi:hypothetical protein